LWSQRAALWPLRCGKGLGAWSLLPLEGFKKALQVQVIVPPPGKADVLLMQGDKMDIVTAHNVAAPLLDGNAVIAPVLCEAPDYVNWAYD
jgi:hypothetical protein